MSTKKNQSILVTGESGSGKTETVKILMSHLSCINKGSKENDVVNKILDSNPLLESFGNSKTVRNDNSSRFGKYTQLQFNGDGVLVGSFMGVYLLEKSRVCGVGGGERGYHFFYQVLEAEEEVRFFFKDENGGGEDDFFNLTLLW